MVTMTNDLQLVRDFPASAEYLTNIYLLERDYGSAANHKLAEWMGVSTSAVTQALGRLKKLGLVSADRYGPTSLTGRGRDLAALILKRHYLIEHLLVRLLDYPWDKADEEAKVLQNQISDELAGHLDERLGHPQTCPHGNPLPGVPIEAKLLQAPVLADVEPGRSILLLRITEEGEAIPAMLPTCQNYRLRPGIHLKIEENGPDQITFTFEDGSPAGSLPKNLARHIRFEYL